MSTRRFAMILGIVFLAIGAAGFVPLLVGPAQGGAMATGSDHGLLFGMFAVNPAHNVVHLSFGLLGLLAERSTRSAILYARVVALAFSLLTVMGMVPGLDDLAGTMPLYGNNIWLHLGLAGTAAYVGWAHRSDTR